MRLKQKSVELKTTIVIYFERTITRFYLLGVTPAPLSLKTYTMDKIKELEGYIECLEKRVDEQEEIIMTLAKIVKSWHPSKIDTLKSLFESPYPIKK